MWVRGRGLDDPELVSLAARVMHPVTSKWVPLAMRILVTMKRITAMDEDGGDDTKANRSNDRQEAGRCGGGSQVDDVLRSVVHGSYVLKITPPHGVVP